MPKPEFEFFEPSGVPDRPVGGIPGLTEKILSHDPETGDYTRVLRFEPGTDTTPMGVQRHDFWEEVWIAEMIRSFLVAIFSPVCVPANFTRLWPEVPGPARKRGSEG